MMEEEELEESNENCVHGLQYCLCLTTGGDVLGDITLDFSSAVGLGEMELIECRGSVSRSRSQSEMSLDDDTESRESPDITDLEESDVEPTPMVENASRRSKMVVLRQSEPFKVPEMVPCSYDTPMDSIGLPPAILCSLCSNQIQPRLVSYMKIQCQGDCSFSCHRQCFFDAMQMQGFTKKKEYKDGYCPTDSCGEPFRAIYDIDKEGEATVYYKDPKARIKKSENMLRKDKKKDPGMNPKRGLNCKFEKKDTTAIVSETATALGTCEAVPSISNESCSFAEPECTKPRVAPLPAHISEPVVHLEKKANEIEEKYAVSSSNFAGKRNPKKPKKETKIDLTSILMKSKRDEQKACTVKKSPEKRARRNISPETERQFDAQIESEDYQPGDVSHYQEYLTTNIFDHIAGKLEPRLPDLVFNTAPWSPSEYFSSDDLKNAILAVACDLLTDEEKNQIATLFLGGFLQIEEFVLKLRYFTCSKASFGAKIGKNEEGRWLEEEKSANDVSSDNPAMASPTNPVVDDCLICFHSIVGRDSTLLTCQKCNEQYHAQCVVKWLVEHSTCPKCRGHWPDPNSFPTLN